MVIAKKLRPWVTDYSALLKERRHGDRLTTGGRITDIDIIRFPDETLCYLKLDDGVGVSNVYLPAKVYEAYKDVVKLHRLVVVAGRLMKQRVAYGSVQHRIIGHTVRDLSHLVGAGGENLNE